ncbi:hypothetical protein [uncultured Ruminococcus sp.]|uniref:hypothetical protein n=1 Tax=uncultured Ruminococcus sp. TaxID=165186 RepID=UPI0025D820C6|nr:hypothetical protein [uncultured Ruminococcus sp.]
MKADKRVNSGESASASSSSLKVDELAEKKKNQKKSLIKLGTMGVISLILFIFSSIAWFNMNRDVGIGEMSLKTSAMPFEIAAYGTEGVRNEEAISSVAPEYKQGSPTTLSDITYYATGAGTDAVRLRYSTGESEVGPGGNGVLDLYLISKVNGSLAIDINLNVKAYATVDKYEIDANDQKIPATDENDAPLYEEDGITPIYQTTPTLAAISDLNTTDYNISTSYLTTLRSAENYIKGHVMFFENEGHMEMTGGSGEEVIDPDSSYYYTGPLINRHYMWSTSSTEVNEVHHIPIYWMWPNTLGQILLDGKYNMRSGIPLVKDADNAVEKTEMATYLKDNKSLVFANASAIDDSVIINHPTQADFDLMSSGYNTADFNIGSNIDYFLIEVTVSLHSESGSGS